MKVFEVELLFEHTATITVRAKDEEEAERIAKQVQFGEHSKKLEEADGDYGALLSVVGVNEVI